MSKSVGQPCQAYYEYSDYWDLPARLYMGTLAMRAAKTRYLPRLHGELSPSGLADFSLEDPYVQRLAITFLYGAYKHSVNSLKGKIFSNPLKATGDSSSFILDMAQSVDSESRDLNTFSMDLFVEALHYGAQYILVDFPAQESSGSVLALSDNIRSGAVPFWIMLAPCDIIGWRVENRAGRQVLTQLRFREKATVYKGDYEDEEREQIRVFYEDRSEVWRKQDNADEYYLYETYKNTLGYIPLVPYYTNRIKDYRSVSPLSDLAFKNLEHWQHGSMQQLASHAARSLILFGAGFDAVPVNAKGEQQRVNKLNIGMHQMITSANDRASLQYLQFPTDALRFGEEKLATIKDEMAVLALGPILQQRPGAVTATETAINTAQSQSILWTWAMSMKAALKTAFSISAQWRKKTVSFDLDVNTDFGIPGGMGPELDLLYKSVSTNYITRARFWKELQRRQVLGDDFDPEREEEDLREEASAFGMMGQDDTDVGSVDDTSQQAA